MDELAKFDIVACLSSSSAIVDVDIFTSRGPINARQPVGWVKLNRYF
jgi:hypothetical protein